MNEVIVMISDDWEGMFLNGMLIDEGHKINEGFDRYVYFKNIEDRFGVDKVTMTWIPNEYQEYLDEHGYFNPKLEDVLNYKGK